MPKLLPDNFVYDVFVRHTFFDVLDPAFEDQKRSGHRVRSMSLPSTPVVRKQTKLVTCRVAKWGILQDGVVGYTDVSTDSEQAMMSAVARQPVSTAIEADQYSFQLYSFGVFTTSRDTSLDHVVFGRRLRK